jgi:hypothetical protein
MYLFKRHRSLFSFITVVTSSIMTSRALFCTLRSTRTLPSLAPVQSRTYLTQVRTFAPPTSTNTTKTPLPPPIKAQKASVSTGTGGPEIIDTVPSTSSEVDVSPRLANGNGNGNGNANGLGSELDLEGQYQSPGTDWSKSYHGLSVQAFAKEIADVLMAPLDPMDVEIKPGVFIFPVLPVPMFFSSIRYLNNISGPDGLTYLPEIKYRRILNKAFGPGGWGLAPRTETNVGPKIVSREYALVCQGRYVVFLLYSIATLGVTNNAIQARSHCAWRTRILRPVGYSHCYRVIQK